MSSSELGIPVADALAVLTFRCGFIDTRLFIRRRQSDLLALDNRVLPLPVADAFVGLTTGLAMVMVLQFEFGDITGDLVSRTSDDISGRISGTSKLNKI